ncbi:unnamed protein product [Protopolystoma xenopodis]|uniref:Uncharacterized protein n=1 Tax=Protopolystoma xenopodis TaxID=117903 RepID=A0A448XGG1_9PLAT|nr:unnamed protein product [Protopolystoma xenopodis]
MAVPGAWVRQHSKASQGHNWQQLNTRPSERELQTRLHGRSAPPLPTEVCRPADQPTSRPADWACLCGAAWTRHMAAEVVHMPELQHSQTPAQTLLSVGLAQGFAKPQKFCKSGLSNGRIACECHELVTSQRGPLFGHEKRLTNTVRMINAT